MDSKQHKTIIAILGILLVVITGGLIYSVLTKNAKIDSLNFVIYYQGEMHQKEKSEITATQTALENKILRAESNYEDLNKKNQDTLMQFSIAEEKMTALRDRLMCPSTIPQVDYTDNGTVSAALKEYTSDYKATDDHYEAVQKNAKITFHNLKSSRTQSFFMVYFADESNGRVNGIFDVLGQCWVNLNNQ
jgi:hypothetical protein